ncbi:MAG: glucosaminidase domain-containing protein [Thiohalomonadaceae bacterium]
MISRKRLLSRSLHALAFIAPVLLAWCLDIYVAEPLRDARGCNVILQDRPVSSASQLAAELDARGYLWPPEAAVPRLGLASLPADIASLGVAERKSLFFRILLPLAMAENERLARLRTRLEQALAGGALWRGTHAWRFVQRLAGSFGVKGDLNDPAVRARLLERVDTLPLGLVLAQGANESAWGTSRFALQGNALFGQWTWNADTGMTPLRRAAGARHQVRAYPDLQASVRAYLHNLNTGHAYDGLRRLRAQARATGVTPDAQALARTLQRYSERGEAYVAEIVRMIRDNGLDRLGTPEFEPLPGLVP